MPHPREIAIKICCIASHDEAARAIAAGAHAIGLVSAMPSGPGVIDEASIAEIAARIPPAIATFLLTARQDAESIVEQHQLCRTTTIQLVDELHERELRKLRAALPQVRLVQVIHVEGEESFLNACKVAPLVDALLLDSGKTKLTVKELGGTGRTHDWRVSRRIRDAVHVPVYLAGGLHAGNVREAIATVAPFGVDVCSGVRIAGKLDQQKLLGFMDAIGGRIHT